jgi:release factor glutamine methyltransferase
LNTVVDSSVFDSTVEAITNLEGENPRKETEELFESAENDIQLNTYISRRINEREPVAYIIGKSKFRGLDLSIDNRVLVPRIETELLVEPILDIPANVRLLDVGTGSGAVALAVKHERPDIEVTVSDISKDALDLAYVNSENLHLPINIKHSNLLENTSDVYYAITANLPYLPKEKIDSYPSEMVNNEPDISLWGGDDGYALINRLLSEVKKRKYVQVIALEVGKFGNMGEVVMEKIRDTGFPIVYGIKDRKEDIRVVVGKR